MTAPVIPVVERDVELVPILQARKNSLTFLWAFLSSFVYLFAPRRVGRIWLKATWTHALAAAVIHLLMGLFWFAAILFTYQVWNLDLVYTFEQRSENYVYNSTVFSKALDTLLTEISTEYQGMVLLEKIGGVAGTIVTLVLCVGIPFFILLPLGARPGINKSCVKHIARSVLLGTGAGHLVSFAILAVFWWRIFFPGDLHQAALMRIYTPMMLTLISLVLWIWIALARIVRLDYRTDDDLPKPHDPLCDDCGYNLIAADVSGRCPECGRPVELSLGEDRRLPTPWESNPRITNTGVIAHQLTQLIRCPRQLYFSMPTLSGQPAAHRWLIGSLVLIAISALPIVPAMALARNAEWSFDLVSGSLAMALVWAGLSCMMVGIETAGIAAFSHMKGHGVYLAAAAKVTCYASILLVVWVYFGGLQLVGFVYWGDEFYFRTMRMGVSRTQQMLLAAALALPHMAGLIWYELTVYRGIRAIQYANK